jgi:anti-sigma B factor antagonist
MQNDSPLSIERLHGTVPGTTIIRLSGPLTLPNVFSFQAELRSGELPRVSILDLSAVPYMDSAGMGAIVNYFTHCGRNGGSLIVAGVSSRVKELFTLTKVDRIIPMATSVAEAESHA